ncbi:MAG TPA: enoyl-CoA hydratase/isomerase family protein [Verrucomicrobiota bacterium]|nr:enoyl-CoA hydratase/isomerase family protein [Verrucomicrobiota bacterium]
MTEQPIRTETEGAVRTIVLNRPERKNSLTGPLVTALRAALAEAVANDAVNVILFRGEGGALCSGLDLSEFRADPPPEWLPGFNREWAGFHLDMYNCPKPAVCALERYAINAGSSFALASDFLVMGETAFLHVGEVAMGMAAPMNLAWLQLRGGRQLITELALLGRRMSADWLYQRGLVHAVVPDADVVTAAMALATELAALPPQTTALMKAQIRRFEAGIAPEQLFAPRS